MFFESSKTKGDLDMDNILKTGTTTIGIVCKDCIVLGADKRATAGNFIANKNVEKVVPISDYMALTTAGTVSDIQLLIKLIKAELKLKEIRSNQKPSVKEGANLLAGMVFSNIRKMSMIPGISHFLVGGYDDEKHLYDLYPDGSISDVEDFVSSGSGSVLHILLNHIQALVKIRRFCSLNIYIHIMVFNPKPNGSLSNILSLLLPKHKNL